VVDFVEEVVSHRVPSGQRKRMMLDIKATGPPYPWCNSVALFYRNLIVDWDVRGPSIE
jgi:hypothetical protein